MSRTTEMARHRSETADQRGQALVEFSLSLIIFVALLVGVFDVGRAVFMYNSVSQAARDIARVTSVHPGSPLGSSSETQDEIDKHQSLIDELVNPTFSCVEIDGQAVTGPCRPGHRVKVEVTATYRPVTPILNLWDMDIGSSSSVELP